jgi:hypothetical protein
MGLLNSGAVRLDNVSVENTDPFGQSTLVLRTALASLSEVRFEVQTRRSLDGISQIHLTATASASAYEAVRLLVLCDMAAGPSVLTGIGDSAIPVDHGPLCGVLCVLHICVLGALFVFGLLALAISVHTRRGRVGQWLGRGVRPLSGRVQ